MTIIKLSKSGRQLQVIDDFGNVFGLSVVAARNVIDGKVSSGYSKAMRLPFSVSPDRFGPSELWDPEGTSKGISPNSSITLQNDSFSAKSLKKEESVKKYEDVEVW